MKPIKVNFYSLALAVSFLLLQGCGVSVLLYDKTPTILVEFHAPIESYADIKEELREFSNEENYKYSFSGNPLKTNGFYFDAKNRKERIAAVVGADEGVAYFYIKSSKISGFRRSKIETEVLADKLSSRLSQIENKKRR